MLKIRRGDRVIIITGKYKGKVGVILKMLKTSSFNSQKILVEGVNIVKKHTKGNPSSGKEGGIVEKESPIHYSNVAIINSLTDKKDKVAFKRLDNGNVVRIFKSNKEVIINA